MAETMKIVATASLEELVAYGIANGASMGASSRNAEQVVPWSFSFHGHPVTHENDDCYLVGGAGEKFSRGDLLIAARFGKDDVTLHIWPRAISSRPTRPVSVLSVRDNANGGSDA